MINQQRYTQAEAERMDKDISQHQKGRRASGSSLTSLCIDFIMEHIERDEVGHYISVKGSIHQEKIVKTNAYTSNIRHLPT